MFKIGEFSKLTRISVRMLRYYDQMGLLKPEVTDKFTGYRLYTAAQIPELQKILLLRDMEFSTEEMKDALRKWDTESAIDCLKAKKAEILEHMRVEQQRIRKIDMAVQDIRDRKIEVHYNITMKEIPSFQILSYRSRIPDYFCEGVLWEKLYAFVEREQIGLCQGVNNLAIYHDEGVTEKAVDVEAGVLVKTPGRNKDGFVYRETEAVKTMACIMVYGPYENIAPAYYSFARWLEDHGQYEMAGPGRQICHVGAFNEGDPEKYLTEVQTPVILRG